MEKIEGMLQLDGLLEGRLSALPEGEKRLQEWVRFAGSVALPFSLEIDGSQFNLLPGRQPLEAAQLGPEPSETVVNALNQLVKLFPASERQHVFSTLRSVEYRANLEIQTLYAMGSQGQIEARQRSVESQTTAPLRPMGHKQKLRLAGLGLAVALVVLAASTFFVDYRQLLARVRDRLTPFDAQAVAVDNAAFEPYFTVEGKASQEGCLVLSLKRTPQYPQSPQDLDKLSAQSAGSLEQRLAVEALARGYVHCELFDRDGRFITAAFERIAPLQQEESIRLRLPLPPDRRLGKIILAY
jgi:hypothetical protein